MIDENAAKAAIQKLNGVSIDGRIIKVSFPAYSDISDSDTIMA